MPECAIKDVIARRNVNVKKNMRRKIHIYIKCMRLNFTFSCRRFHEIFLIFVLQFLFHRSSPFPWSRLPFFASYKSTNNNNNHLWMQCALCQDVQERMASVCIFVVPLCVQWGKSDLVFWLSLMMALFLSSSSSSLQLCYDRKKSGEQEAREDNCIAARIHLANACAREKEKKRKRQSIEQNIYIYIHFLWKRHSMLSIAKTNQQTSTQNWMGKLTEMVYFIHVLFYSFFLLFVSLI